MGAEGALGKERSTPLVPYAPQYVARLCLSARVLAEIETSHPRWASQKSSVPPATQERRFSRPGSGGTDFPVATNVQLAELKFKIELGGTQSETGIPGAAFAYI